VWGAFSTTTSSQSVLITRTDVIQLAEGGDHGEHGERQRPRAHSPRCPHRLALQTGLQLAQDGLAARVGAGGLPQVLDHPGALGRSGQRAEDASPALKPLLSPAVNLNATCVIHSYRTYDNECLCILTLCRHIRTSRRFPTPSGLAGRPPSGGRARTTSPDCPDSVLHLQNRGASPRWPRPCCPRRRR